MTSIELSQEVIDSARRAGEAKLSGLSSEDVKKLRRKCKTNLFFLAYSILGYTKLSESLHLDLCRWMKLTNKEQFREILLPRSHYKSTIVTIADTIQIILPDDVGDQPYPRNLGPNCRILVGHETHDAAARFLYSITAHFTGNPLLVALFPECVPDFKKQRVNKNELELPRSGIFSEPTIDTVGVSGRSQGRHYNYIKADDLYGAAARDSKAERESTISWVDNLQSLLISPRTDHIDFVGTRWAFDDVYNHIHNTYGNRLHKYIRSCEEKGPDGIKRPIFPEEFTPESLEILKKNRVVWNAQYANNPLEGGALFQPEWKRFYIWSGPKKVKVIDGNYSHEVDTGDLDRVILIDPAMNGKAGYCVTGTDFKNRTYILDAVKHDWKPPELVDKIFHDVLKWQPRVVAIEEVLFSGLFQHWIQREMQIRGIKFRIVPVRTRQKAKEARVLGLSNYFSSGQIFFNQGQTDLIEEFDQFGATDDYHILDALAYGPELWRHGSVEKMMQKNAEFNNMLGRDSLTGYSEY